MAILDRLDIQFGLQDRDFKKKIRGVNDNIKRTGDVARKATISLGALAAALRPLIAAFSIFESIRLADEFVLLRARVKESTQTTEEFTKAFDGLRRTSVQTGASLEGVVNVFQRLSFVRAEIGATVDDMLEFTDTVSKLGITSGASPGALTAGLTQLGQALSSDIVRAEEFNSIMENIPAVGVAIAKEFGVTTGELRRLVIEGEVLSQDVFQAILNQSQKTREEFERFPKTIGRAFANLRLRLQEAIGSIDEATGATKVLIVTLEITGRAISIIASLIRGFGKSISAFFTLLVASIINTFNQATRAVKQLINIVLRGLNAIREEDIQLLDTNLPIETKAIAEAAMEEARREINDGLRSFKQAFEQTGLGTVMDDTFGEGTETIKEQSSQVKALGRDYKQLVESLGESGEESKKAAREAAKALEEQQRRIEDINNSMADFFASSIDGFDSFKQAAISAIREIANNLLRLSFGGTAGGGFGGAIAGALFNAVGGAISAANFGQRFSGVLNLPGGGAIPVPRQAGGPVSPNRPFLVGEKGPELMVPSTAGTIIPNNKLGGQQVVVNQSVNFSTGITQTVRAEVMRLLPAIEAQTVDAVRSAKQRGSL